MKPRVKLCFVPNGLMEVFKKYPNGYSITFGTKLNYMVICEDFPTPEDCKKIKQLNKQL